MLIRVIITFLTIFLTQMSGAQVQCSEIYDSLSLRDILESYPLARVQREAWELETAGEIFTSRNSSRLGEWLRSREGTYPLLMLRTGELLISHRLPDPNASESSPYLATHRGLENLYRTQMGQNLDIIFAGEIRVTVGEVRSLIDMSGAFHFRLSDLGPRATDAQLIMENGARLDYAKTVLQSYGALDPATAIKNFWYQNHSVEPGRRGDGHMTAKEEARFEMQCYANPSCWQTYKTVEQFLIDLNQVGGFRFFLRTSMETRADVLLDHTNLIAEIPAEGVLPMMARPGLQRNGWMERLANDIPQMRQLLDLE